MSKPGNLALVNGIKVLMKKVCLPYHWVYLFFCHVRTQHSSPLEDATRRFLQGTIATALISDFPISKTVRK
jgi:hypothetical protein